MDNKKIAIGTGLIVAAALTYLLSKRPKPPPPPDYGLVQGHVLDTTGEKITNAKIYVDGVFHCYTDPYAFYRTDYVPFGPHTITAEANNYISADFAVNIAETVVDLDLTLEPVPPLPTDWTEGVSVTEIEVQPMMVYLGESVEIRVHIHYQFAAQIPPTGLEICGTVLVNGIELNGTWTIHSTAAVVRLSYTTVAVGNFIVKAQDKSAGFSVLPAPPPGTYYCPWGGTRMPKCTEILIPAVAPFADDIEHPGGDFVREVNTRGIYIDTFTVWGYWDEIEDKLPEAYPTAWTPGVTVSTWVLWLIDYPGRRIGIVVASVTDDCQPYWDTKGELSKMLATGLGGTPIAIPDEIKAEYGGVWDLRRGLRDWTKQIRWRSIAYGSTHVPYVKCPYCGIEIQGPPYTLSGLYDRVSHIRLVLDHIETAHPDHPLTEPGMI